LRLRRIPGGLSLAVAMLALPYGLASGWSVVPDLSAHLVTALALGAILLGSFGLGNPGAGDVKMMMALGLWLSPGGAFAALVIMTIAVGLSRLMLARRYRHRLSRPRVPYGVAIAVAGIGQVLVELLHLLP
jgi:prepilin peptidase CpaA